MNYSCGWITCTRYTALLFGLISLRLILHRRGGEVLEISFKMQRLPAAAHLFFQCELTLRCPKLCDWNSLSTSVSREFIIYGNSKLRYICIYGLSKHLGDQRVTYVGYIFTLNEVKLWLRPVLHQPMEMSIFDRRQIRRSSLWDFFRCAKTPTFLKRFRSFFFW